MDAMWEGVLDGAVTTIGPDHVPRQRGVPPERIAAVASANAARLYNMPEKGQIVVGQDVDLVLVDLDLERVVDPANLESFFDYSPYEGMVLNGWPVRTISRGTDVVIDGEIAPDAREHPQGRYLRRL